MAIASERSTIRACTGQRVPQQVPKQQLTTAGAGRSWQIQLASGAAIKSRLICRPVAQESVPMVAQSVLAWRSSGADNAFPIAGGCHPLA